MRRLRTKVTNTETHIHAHGKKWTSPLRIGDFLQIRQKIWSRHRLSILWCILASYPPGVLIHRDIWLITSKWQSDVAIFVFSVCNLNLFGVCRQLLQLLPRMRIVRLLFSWHPYHPNLCRRNGLRQYYTRMCISPLKYVHLITNIKWRHQFSTSGQMQCNAVQLTIFHV